MAKQLVTDTFIKICIYSQKVFISIIIYFNSVKEWKYVLRKKKGQNKTKGPVTPVKCTNSAHRGTGTINDSCRFDIGRFRVEPTDLRKVSTSEWQICISQCPQAGRDWASSSLRSVISFTQRFRCGKDIVAKSKSLYRRTSSTNKYKSSKLCWRILEDNKQNKRENRGKNTVRIFACNSPSRQCLPHILYSSNATNSFPLSFLPSKPCLFWCLLSVNSILLVFNSIPRWKSASIIWNVIKITSTLTNKAELRCCHIGVCLQVNRRNLA